MQCVNVSITDDGIGERDETFIVELTNVSSGILGEPARAIVTIIDDDGTLNGCCTL